MTGVLAGIERVSIPGRSYGAPPPRLGESPRTTRGDSRVSGGAALRLRRAWPRGEGHLLLEYVTPDGAAVAGQWFGRPDGTPDTARLGKVARQTDAGVPAGAVTVLSELGVLLQAAGADRRLPSVAGLVAQDGATLLVHRPERRAVVRLTDGGRRRYAKVVRPERLDELAAAGRRALGVPGFAAPELLDTQPAAGVTVWSELAGRSLYDLLGEARLPGAARLTGRALRSLHDAGVAGTDRAHTAIDELGVAEQWVARRTLACPAPDRRLADAVAVVRRQLAAGPSGAPVLGHRDFYDKQVFVTDAGEVGLLDFDTLAAAEAALDLANALVHFELRARQGRCSPATAASAAGALLDGYRPDDATVTRLRAYAAATRLRLACVYRFRPAWTEVADALLDGFDGPLAGVADAVSMADVEAAVAPRGEVDAPVDGDADVVASGGPSRR